VALTRSWPRMKVLLTMKKIDIGALKKAYEGR
jgi:hypothetical protein